MAEVDFLKGTYQVIGPPGCGKTTFLKKQVEKIVAQFAGSYEAAMWNNPVLICSLTRAAAAEIAGRDLPIAKAQVGTLHAHCFRSLDMPKIFGKEAIELWNEEFSMKLTSPTNEFSEDSDELGGGIVLSNTGDELLQEYDLLRHRMEPESTWSNEIKRFAENYETFKLENEFVDFTDLIVQVVNSSTPPPGNPAVIMVDEAQDLSALEYSLIAAWSEYASATIVVGDPYQSLYTWRGASPDIFDPSKVDEDHRKILGQSYRVPERVVHVAKSWLEDFLHGYYEIEYSPRQNPVSDEEVDVRGTVGVSEDSLHSCQAIIDHITEVISKNDGRTVMLQASCAFLIRAVIFELKEQGIPFSNPWRKASSEWNPMNKTGRGLSMIERMRALLMPCPENSNPAGWGWKELTEWTLHMKVKDTLIRGAKKRIEANYAIERTGGKVNELWDEDGYPIDSGGENHEPEIVGLDELATLFTPEAYKVVGKIATGELSAFDTACWWQSKLLAAKKSVSEYYTRVIQNYGFDGIAKNPRVFVGTIHSFKGSEASVVYVFPDLSRTGFAEWAKGDGEDRNSVVRMFYVAMTRAIEELYICRNSSNKCVPLRRESQVYTARYEKAMEELPI